MMHIISHSYIGTRYFYENLRTLSGSLMATDLKMTSTKHVHHWAMSASDFCENYLKIISENAVLDSPFFSNLSCMCIQCFSIFSKYVIY